MQSCRHCGAGAPVDVHFCPQCERILTLARHGDYFSFFGLPRKLAIDLDGSRAALPRARAASSTRTTSTPPRRQERLASLERASYLNDAYRVLKQPLDRAEYLLKLEGLPGVGQHQDATELPAGVLEEVFALNEELDDIRAAREAGASPRASCARASRPRGGRSRSARPARRRSSRRCSSGGTSRWTRRRPPDVRRATLESLRSLLQERSYIANLIAATNRERGEA